MITRHEDNNRDRQTKKKKKKTYISQTYHHLSQCQQITLNTSFHGLTGHETELVYINFLLY